MHGCVPTLGNGQTTTQDQVTIPFIQAKDGRLFEGEQAFRFISFNIPNLHNIEDEVDPRAPSPWRWPDEFEIADALESVRQMGGTVARTYVLSVRRDDSDMGGHVYIRGIGDFNEEAFCTLDRVLHEARKRQIRVIIPFVDQWRWWGGIEQYAQFRGKSAEDFWTDREIREDFKKTIAFVLGRSNSIDGTPYRDDPAIFGWETGNELDAPAEWTRDIAAYCKSLDPRHLVIDGNSLHGIPKESLECPHIDVVTSHHYPGGDKDIPNDILEARRFVGGKKAYFVGEFGFLDTATIRRVLDTVIENEISGALLWSLRFHRREGGFYWHSEPSGMGIFKAYHWPGFSSGSAYDESQVLQILSDAAFRIRGEGNAPQARTLAPPTILSITQPGAISWQGTAGAREYTLERAEAANGPWTILGSGISDADFPYRSLFRDESALAGIEYWYRAIARSKSGSTSAPSIPFGPVTFSTRQFVDELADLSRLDRPSPEISITSEEARSAREDPHRARLDPGEALTYHLPGELTACRTRIFFRSAATNSSQENPLSVQIAGSLDGERYEPIGSTIQPAKAVAGDYAYLPQIDVNLSSIPRRTRYLRISLPAEVKNAGSVEVSWVELDYRDLP